MKKLLVFIVSLILFSCNGQDYSKTIKDQAEKAGQLFLDGDFESYVKFVYPKIVEGMGGSEKMIQILDEGIEDMYEEGIEFSKITFDNPSKVIQNKGELQCTITQSLVMETPKGRLLTKFTLIAISTNQGKNWLFIDTSNKNIQELRELLPNLSTELVILKQQKPILLD